MSELPKIDSITTQLFLFNTVRSEISNSSTPDTKTQSLSMIKCLNDTGK